AALLKRSSCHCLLCYPCLRTPVTYLSGLYRTKPRARLCEPWENIGSLLRAAKQRQRPFAKYDFGAAPNRKDPDDNSVAAPRFRKFLRAVTQGSQSLALGLVLVAASQLIWFAPTM